MAPASKRRKKPAPAAAKSRRTKRSSVFRPEDYNSDNGMLTDVWGPAQWHVLHTMSFNYPVHPTAAQKKQYRAHILGLRHVLPCGKCRANLEKNFAKLPLTPAHMESRASFSRYVYDLHELVNAMLGKESGLSYADVRDRYEEFRARCSGASPAAAAATATTPAAPRIEAGCTEPLQGVKQRCLIRIVPKTTTGATLLIDKACHARKTE